jgi:hypothetical protein
MSGTLFVVAWNMSKQALRSKPIHGQGETAQEYSTEIADLK